jgi:hypothetical protein
LQTNIWLTTKSQEENVDQEGNGREMQPQGCKGILGQVYWHPFQAPGSHQHEQVWPGLSQGLFSQNPSQWSRTHLLQTIQTTGGTQPIHRPNPGWMAQTQSGQKILLSVQLAHFLRA